MSKYWGAALGGAEVVLGGLLFLAFNQFDDFLRLEPPARAAWVGAIGSITSMVVAACVAVGVSIYNNARSAQLAAEAVKANRGAALAVMHHMHWRMWFTVKALAKPNITQSRITYLHAMLEDTVEGFERFNPIVIADERGVLDFYQFRNEVLRVRRHFGSTIERHQKTGLVTLRRSCGIFARRTLPTIQRTHSRMLAFRKRYSLTRQKAPTQ